METTTDYPTDWPGGTNLATHRFPLRDNLDAILILPRDLTSAEVKRLAAFMQTLVVDA